MSTGEPQITLKPGACLLDIGDADQWLRKHSEVLRRTLRWHLMSALYGAQHAPYSRNLLLRVRDEQIVKFHYLPALHEPEQDVPPCGFASPAQWLATWK